MGLYYLSSGIKCYEGIGSKAVMAQTRSSASSYCWAFTNSDGERVYGSAGADATRELLLRGKAPLLCATDGCNCVRLVPFPPSPHPTS